MPEESSPLVELAGSERAPLAAAAPAGGLGIGVPSVTAVGVDGGSNAPGSDPNGADVEVALDIDVIGAAAPGAAQVVYFAPNSDSGFIDAISEAAAPRSCGTRRRPTRERAAAGSAISMP